MSRHVRSPRAMADLREHALFLGRDDAEAGIRFLESAEQTFDWLGVHPDIGRSRTDISPHLRTIRSFAVDGFPNHLVFYRKIRGGIEIVRVLHGARDLRADLLRPE